MLRISLDAQIEGNFDFVIFYFFFSNTSHTLIFLHRHILLLMYCNPD